MQRTRALLRPVTDHLLPVAVILLPLIVAACSNGGPKY
jgi:hypothetical protein